MNKNLAIYYMEKFNLDALVATQPVSLRYFCGFDCWFTNWLQEWMGKPGASNSNAPLFCIFTRSNETILIVPAVVAPFAIDTDINEARFFGSVPPVQKSNLGQKDLSFPENELNEFDKSQLKILGSDIFADPVSALENIIKENGLENSNLGFELREFNESVFGKISENLKGCSFKDCTEIIRLTRMIKTGEEILLLSKSAELNELALQESARSIRANTTFREAFNKFKDIVESKGGIAEHYIFSSYGCGVSDNKEYLFGKNQFILLDCGAYLSNYISDAGTTVFLDNINKKYLEIFNRLNEGLIIGLDSLKVGVQCSKVNNIVIEYLDKHDIRKTDTHGHGIGLQPSEYPIISSTVPNFIYHNGFEESSSDFKLEENMVIALELPYYIYGQGSYIVEVSAIVTKNGYQLLIPQERKTPIMNY
ncbi:MAG: M24 family metallopeptidase [Actinobacteria bacterium]|nr:M24 family metallopeptidase [Actinomycetota bacterium]